MRVNVTESELAYLEHLLVQSHAKHAKPGVRVADCDDSKCIEARWGIEWLRRSRACLSGAIPISVVRNKKRSGR